MTDLPAGGEHESPSTRSDDQTLHEQCACHGLPRQLESWRCRPQPYRSLSRLPYGQLVEPCRRVPYVHFFQEPNLYFSDRTIQCYTEAMDRIHRLGQHRPVQAIKLVIEDSIESRIIQLQEKKAAMVDATLSADDSVCA